MCPDIPDPDKGQIDFVPDDTAPFSLGTNATYSCDDGYSLVSTDAGPMTDPQIVFIDIGVPMPDPIINPRMCTGNGSSHMGQWTGTPLDCVSTAPSVGSKSHIIRTSECVYWFVLLNFAVPVVSLPRDSRLMPGKKNLGLHKRT